MKRLVFALFFFASNAHAAKLDEIPSADPPLDVNAIVSYWAGPDHSCLIRTNDNHAIFLRWLPDESMVERRVAGFYTTDPDGKRERQNPEWAYEGKLQLESVSKARAVKIAEQGKLSVWAYRESDAMIVLTPGVSGDALMTGGLRGVSGCPMAVALLSTRQAAECKTTTGCGRMALMTTPLGTITAGVSEGTISARITARK
jgi:hypothetical protein